MANLNNLANLTTSINVISNLIMVSPQSVVGYQPQPPINTANQQDLSAPSILFNYEGEQTAMLESDITDHYVEDNTALQDQISLKPEIITTHGFVGELNDVAPSVLQPLLAIASKLTVIGAYAPVLSTAAIIAYNEAAFLYAVGVNASNAAIGAWSSINGTGGTSVINGSGIEVLPNQNKQQKYFQQFYGYWQSRTLFTIQTPWAIFQNMAIKSIRAIQGAETRMITDFEVQFKMIRFAETIFTSAAGNSQGRAAMQSANSIDLGTSTPPLSTTSFTGSIAQTAA